MCRCGGRGIDEEGTPIPSGEERFPLLNVCKCLRIEEDMMVELMDFGAESDQLSEKNL